VLSTDSYDVSMTDLPTSKRPWSFVVSSPWQRTLSEWEAEGRRLEELGYHAIMLADHTYSADPFLPLVAVAAATQRLRVGTLVLNVGFWHPLLLARSAATLQLLSGDRFDLGIGAGWAKKEHDDLGIAFDSPRVRVDRLNETGALLRQALRGETIQPTPFYPVTAASVQPPVDVAPRLLTGGHGPRLLHGAAQWADIIQLTGVTDDRQGTLQLHEATLADFECRVAWIRDAAPERFAAIELSVLVQRVTVTSSTSETASVLASTAAEFSCSEELLRESPIALIGTVEDIAEKLRMLRARLGITHASVFAPATESFAAVIALLG
jgi:probable F420-dependent oxidoreductase